MIGSGTHFSTSSAARKLHLVLGTTSSKEEIKN